MKTYRSILLFLLDLSIIIMMYVFAVLIRFDFSQFSMQYIFRVIYLIPVITTTFVIVFIAFNIHKTLWTTSGLYEFVTVSFAVVLSIVIFWSVNALIDQRLIYTGVNRLFNLDRKSVV